MALGIYENYNPLEHKISLLHHPETLLEKNKTQLTIISLLNCEAARFAFFIFSPSGGQCFNVTETFQSSLWILFSGSFSVFFHCSLVDFQRKFFNAVAIFFSFFSFSLPRFNSFWTHNGTFQQGSFKFQCCWCLVSSIVSSTIAKRSANSFIDSKTCNHFN